MRHFSYTNDAGETLIISEHEIHATWWPVWYERMSQKYERSYVDEYYCFLDALEEWIIINRAHQI